MADITITAANCLRGSGAIVNRAYDAGATVTAGQAVYLDTAVSPPTWKLADCDDTAAKAVVGGIALHAASAGQPLAVQTGGRITIGGTVTVGEIYVLSGTAGGIAPEGDLATGDYVSKIGVGVTAAIIEMAIHNSGVQVP